MPRSKRYTMLTCVTEVISAEASEHQSPEQNCQTDSPLRRIKPKGFSYLAPIARFEVEKPYHTRLPFLNGFPRTNIAEQAYPVTVGDVSGYENHFKLETTGFEYVKMLVFIKEWTNDLV
jgi:hypothetical protein